MAKYQVMREVSTKYGKGGICITTFNAESDAEAIVKILDNCGYGYFDEEDRRLGEDGFKMPELNEALECLSGTNGEGSDFVYEVLKVETGEVLFDEGLIEEEEDW